MLDRVAEQNQIEVKSSWRARVRPFAAVGLLDFEEAIEHLTSGERRFADGNRIQISRLIRQPLPFRIGFDETGNRQAGDEWREAIDGKPESGFAVAEVSAERDGDSQCSMFNVQCPMFIDSPSIEH